MLRVHFAAVMAFFSNSSVRAEAWVCTLSGSGLHGPNAARTRDDAGTFTIDRRILKERQAGSPGELDWPIVLNNRFAVVASSMQQTDESEGHPSMVVIGISKVTGDFAKAVHYPSEGLTATRKGRCVAY